MKLENQRKYRTGFTLLEVLLVVGLIAILAGIVIVAINPSKNLRDTNNGQRMIEVNTIMDALYLYSIDNNGSFPADISSASGASTEECLTAGTDNSNDTEICITGASCPAEAVDLSPLTTGGVYLPEIPSDPSIDGGNLTGYNVIRNSTNGRLVVCAPNAEDTEISITK